MRGYKPIPKKFSFDMTKKEYVEWKKRREQPPPPSTYGVNFGTLPGEDVLLSKILELHDAGRSSFSIERYMNDNYPKQARGKAWYETSIARIIQREVQKRGGIPVPERVVPV